jgi:iron(III) transport system substrate-binding protein
MPTRRTFLRTTAAAGVAAIGGRFLAGCSSSTSTEVVLYTSVDQPIAAKVVAAFEKEHANTKIRLVTDTEASKSVGLATRLGAEKSNPVCHVWWGNEVFYTVGLCADGLFTPMSFPVLGEIAPQFRDEQGRWAGCGLRARVIAVNDAAGSTKGSIQDLLDGRFKGKVGLARPLTGTTGGHVAALYALWGETKADSFFRGLKSNGAIMLGGNSAVAEQVGSGNLTIGLTDNDDIFATQRNGGELWQVLPDQAADQIGTLAIPTTVALIKRDDQPAAASALAAYLLSSTCERLLIDEHFAAYSVRSGAPETLKTMNLRFEDVAKLMTTAPRRAADILDGRI